MAPTLKRTFAVSYGKSALYECVPNRHCDRIPDTFAGFARNTKATEVAAMSEAKFGGADGARTRDLRRDRPGVEGK